MVTSPSRHYIPRSLPQPLALTPRPMIICDYQASSLIQTRGWVPSWAFRKKPAKGIWPLWGLLLRSNEANGPR